MFRIANKLKTQIANLDAKVLISLDEPLPEGGVKRKFINLELETKRISFLTLSWTIVHPIDEKSPFYGLTSEDLSRINAEIIVHIQGFEETYNSIVHARTSYKNEEIIFGAKFDIPYQYHADGTVTFDVDSINDYQMVEIH